MDLDSSLPRLRLADARPLIGWGFFYVLIVAAWLALTVLGEGSLLERCLAPISETAWPRLFLMWSLMSLAMMLPTSLPTLSRLWLLLQQRPQAISRFSAFLFAYMSIWLGFSAVVAILQLALAQFILPAFEPLIAAGLLATAGLYQSTRLKQACLTKCRHPMTFFMAHWRDGIDGALAMGLRHGRDCLGCCWALMSLALIGGTMTLGWMALGMALMVLEKLAGTGRFVTAPLGVVLIAGAFYQFGVFIFAA